MAMCAVFVLGCCVVCKASATCSLPLSPMHILVTALERTDLRKVSLDQLRKYIEAYNIRISRPVDKDDIVDAMLAARVRFIYAIALYPAWQSASAVGVFLHRQHRSNIYHHQTPQGFLKPIHEKYYQQHWVLHNPPSTRRASDPSSAARRQGIFSRFSHPSPSSNPCTPRSPVNSSINTTPASVARSDTIVGDFPRPDLDPRNSASPLWNVSESSAGQSQSTHYGFRQERNQSRTQPMPPDIPNQSPRIPSNSSSHPFQVSPAPPVSSTPPPLSTLLTQPRATVAALPIGTLKKILWEARVRLPPGACEKEDLVERVWILLEEERRILPENNSLNQENLDAEARDEGSGVPLHDGHDSDSAYVHLNPNDIDDMVEVDPSEPSTSQPITTDAEKKTPFTGVIEHSGECVICQDAEANIAVVDCGYVAFLVTSQPVVNFALQPSCNVP